MRGGDGRINFERAGKGGKSWSLGWKSMGKWELVFHTQAGAWKKKGGKFKRGKVGQEKHPELTSKVCREGVVGSGIKEVFLQ